MQLQPSTDFLQPEMEAGPSNQAVREPSPPSLPLQNAPPIHDSPPVISSRSGRQIRLPGRFMDYLPCSSTPESSPSPPSPPVQPLRRLVKFKIIADDMGVYRVYPRYPGIPKRNGLEAVTDAPALQSSTDSGAKDSSASSDMSLDALYSAFSHPTAGLLMAWQYSGGTNKTGAELDRLWTSHIQDPAFDPSVHTTFSHDQEKRRIEKYLATSNPFNAAHGWKRSSVKIPLPHEGSKYKSERDPNIPCLTVDGVYHRDITDIIINTFQSKIASETFHILPYEEYWKPSDDSEPVRMFGEAYTSPAFIDAYREIHSLPRDPGDELEYIVSPLMFWSDATQLANFGDASLWPIYLFFANQSKYTRGRPTTDACHHIAYIPGVCHLRDCRLKILTFFYSSRMTFKIYTVNIMAGRHQTKCTLTASVS